MLNVRVFLSHSSEDKIIAGILKDKLQRYGIDIFLAHDDIEGGTEWMSRLYAEIKECEIFLILLSEKYHSAYFNDQETGIALSNQKPIIPILIDSTIPYGFMSKYQGIRCELKFYDVKGIIDVIMKHSNSGQKFIDVLISSLESAESFNHARKFGEELQMYHKLTDEQLERIAKAYSTNDQIYHSFMANPIVYGILKRNRKQLKKETLSSLKLD